MSSADAAHYAKHIGDSYSVSLIDRIYAVSTYTYRMGRSGSMFLLLPIAPIYIYISNQLHTYLFYCNIIMLS